ncbi:thioesterase family protein [uncultured Maritimibacter sp.]|jgi:acyl-CoA thioester hydrolase|uniref:thioesterase family protein n=1 Tax=uncultured Maritimibacter sp. TaxID=991866 RepID=UPI000A6E23CB|nr:thioesterase family protein [uncultured Maritimibacter sp.]
MGKPHISPILEIKPEWIDFNGHLNMAYYSVLFDTAADHFYPGIGFGPDYIRERGLTTYTAEFHICYLRELHLGAKLRVHSWLLDYDRKRFHTFQEIHHEDGWIAATGEALGLHIDMSGPRVAPMPDDVFTRLESFHATHRPDAWPERAGRKIGIARKD